MGFPDDHDRNLINQGQRLLQLAVRLDEWVRTHNPERRQRDLRPITDPQELELLQLRRRAISLLGAARVPAAAAVYGPSQVGKSLFIGQVLRPHDPERSPLGRDEALGEPAYYRYLSFADDINPRLGSYEATALVTRFTTKDRIASQLSTMPNYPVIVRALSRAEWLRVLARGFKAECRERNEPNKTWDEEALDKLFQSLPGASADKTEGQWRMDLIDVYGYVKRYDGYRFQAREESFNGLLGRYPLTEEGYVQVAARLFWDGWEELTPLFRDVDRFLSRLGSEGFRGLLSHWAGVRFLLDSQQSPWHENPASRCFRRVEWGDFQLQLQGGLHVLDYQAGRRSGGLDLAILQAALLELVIPILPDRLTADWRHVLEYIDLLDIPGMKAGREGAEAGGKRDNARDVEARREIVKRGKVFYLFDRYIEDLQIQTLLLLVKGGNLEVRGYMKDYVNKWGHARYGRTRAGQDWARLVSEENLPALFIGLTGIDEEISKGHPTTQLYDARLKLLVDTLDPLMMHFGERDKPFTNIYPIRYPGSWDQVKARRERDGQANLWEQARQAFLSSERVRTHVLQAEQRWQIALDDRDGGQSLISAGFLKATTPLGKQRHLAEEIEQVYGRLLQLAEGWVVEENVNLEREKREEVARKMLNWLLEDCDDVYYRVLSLQKTLCFREGDAWELADLPDTLPSGSLVPVALERILPKRLQEVLDRWASVQVPQRWQEHRRDISAGRTKTQLTSDFQTFARYLKEYLCHAPVLEALVGRLAEALRVPITDAAARRHARRRYVRLILNDYVMNPGPDASQRRAVTHNVDNYGLMAPMLRRWLSRLGECLAETAGKQIVIPPGNPQLRELLSKILGSRFAHPVPSNANPRAS